jgi:hypothetical protein
MITGHNVPTEHVHRGGTLEANADQCTKLIRKLRWIGLEDEAARLQDALRVVAPEHRGTVIADSNNTD